MAANLGYVETAMVLDNDRIYLGKDCVGAEVEFQFLGNDYIICFPNFDFRKREPWPIARGTNMRSRWFGKKTDGDSFGSPYTYDKSKKTIDVFSCRVLIVRSKNGLTATEARQAKRDLIEWRSLFPEWLATSEYMDLAARRSKMEYKRDAVAFFIFQDNPSQEDLVPFEDVHINLEVNTPTGLTRQSLTKALKLAATGDRPPGYYLQIMSALKYFNTGEYRQCVLDAATGFEMALIQMLDDALKDLPVEQKRLIEDKYRQIMGLSDCLRKLGADIPTQSNIKKNLSDVRNLAIHRGKVVAEEDAEKALAFAQEFIYSRFPLGVEE